MVGMAGREREVCPRCGPRHRGHRPSTRDELIAHLEEYQRDLEEAAIRVDTRIKELRRQMGQRPAVDRAAQPR